MFLGSLNHSNLLCTLIPSPSPVEYYWSALDQVIPPSLLTIATHTALTQLADLVLSDKLVPAAVLSIVPKHVQVRITRTFPGNADGAQTGMMEAAVEAAKQGLTVVRVCLFFFYLFTLLISSL